MIFSTDPMLQFSSLILSNDEIAPHYFHMVLKAPISSYLPGQFVMIKVNNTNIPLLRRAMAILSWRDEELEIVYKAIGLGTKELSKRAPGEKLEVIGPLGNSYEIPDGLGHAYMITGGVGMSPLMPLARALTKKRIKTTLFFGGASVTDLVMRHEFSDLGVMVIPVTMDGSLGKRGLVTDVMEEGFKATKPDPQNDMVFTCGPHAMMRKVYEIASKYGLKTQVSMETRMACGTGVCLGCVIKNKNGSYLRACTEGPVYYGEEIDWNARLD